MTLLHTMTKPLHVSAVVCGERIDGTIARDRFTGGSSDVKYNSIIIHTQ